MSELSDKRRWRGGEAIIRQAVHELSVMRRFDTTHVLNLDHGTTTQICMTSPELGWQIKLFVSELRGVGRLLLAPPTLKPGFDDQPGWASVNELDRAMRDRPGYQRHAVESLQNLNPLQATSGAQLRLQMEWLQANQRLIDVPLIERVARGRKLFR